MESTGKYRLIDLMPESETLCELSSRTSNDMRVSQAILLRSHHDLQKLQQIPALNPVANSNYTQKFRSVIATQSRDFTRLLGRRNG